MINKFMALDYTTIPNPFNNQLKKINSDINFKSEPISNVNSPSQIKKDVIDGKTWNNMWVKNWIKSVNYKPQKTGFKIDGITGKIECAGIVLTGGSIKFGQTDYNTGIGIFFGYSNGNYKFSIGNSSTDYFNFDGAHISLSSNNPNAIIINYGSDISLLHGGDVKFTSVVAPTACTAFLAGEGAGNLSNGDYYYKITFVNEAGETELGATSNKITITDNSANGKVRLLNIPISSSVSVVARRIYRTKAGGSIYYLLDTISDNTTTIYIDNIADSNLDNALANFRENSTFGKIFIDGKARIKISSTNVFIGNRAGDSNFLGYENVFLGEAAGYSNNNGYFNTFIGAYTGYSNTIGVSNIFIGMEAGYDNISGVDNVFIGMDAGVDNISGYANVFIGTYSGYHSNNYYNTFLGYCSGDYNNGDYNTFIGAEAGYKNTTSDNNVFIGADAGYNNTTGNNNVFIGYAAGFYNETESNNLYIDGTGSGLSSVRSLIYGKFAFMTADQFLRVNGALIVGGNAALDTSATDEFLNIPTMAGTPTGTPTAYTGKVSIVYDTTNNKLYVYNGGWKSVALS